MEKMSPEKAMYILNTHGLNVTIEEATSVLDFLKKLAGLAIKLEEQNILQKTVLNFAEASRYLNISQSHLYKLTSQKLIPHFCPEGKKLYFRRDEIDQWLLRNRQASVNDIDKIAADYIIRNNRGR